MKLFMYGDDYIESASSGEKYKSTEVSDLKEKKINNTHLLVIDGLDENRFYEISFVVTAKQAHLRFKSPKKTQFNSKQTTKTFHFNFQTTFDIDAAARYACKQESDNSCYTIGSNCTSCKPNCYQVKSNQDIKNNLEIKTSSLKPILCEVCPCDMLRSTGECIESNINRLVKSQTNFQSTQQIECKKCLYPYTGLLCNDCINDGFDYYKNEMGECVKCDCNNNSAYDNSNNLTKNKIKCQPITGLC
jgi:hypothetical protein